MRGVPPAPNQLAPGDFPLPQQPDQQLPGAAPAPAVDHGLSDADRITLGRTLDVLKQSRQAASSVDKKVAAEGRRRLMMVLGYITGFLDAKGMVDTTASPVGNGLDGLFPQAPAQAQTLDNVLDELEKNLQGLIDAETRGPVANFLKGLSLTIAVLAYTAEQLGL
jgi:hypothetical protein